MPRRRSSLRVLALGAHSDDIEIGAGGTILRLVAEGRVAAVDWVVFSAAGVRAEEARAGATAFLGSGVPRTVDLHDFRDGFLPYVGGEVKEVFERLKDRPRPDLILTHRREDLHQDHRLVSELTWNTFRDDLILEYEIPKYEGDMGPANVYVELPEDVVRRKVELLLATYGSQASRSWFTADTFEATLRLRGIESNAASGRSEAFVGRKIVI